MSWQRTYVRKTPIWFLIVFGVIAGFIGLVFTLFSPLIGVLILLAAAGIPFAFWYFSTNTTISCNEQGFHVRVENRRKGTTEASFGWHEIAATNYYERTYRDSEGSNTRAYFEVETVRGKAFSVDNQTKNFRDLIELFNHMAPQVPYVWKQRTGFTVSLGPMTVRRGAYVSVPREEAGSM